MAYDIKMGVTKGLQRNDGVGDYFQNGDGSWTILATLMANPRHSDLILAHEFIEVLLIRAAGIPEPVINAFDAYFEEQRRVGIVPEDAEPGDDPTAPYHAQHILATRIEKMLCEEGFRLDWDAYCQAVHAAE